MAIDSALLERLQAKLGLSRSRVYALIKERSQRLLITREQAAVALAHEAGINVSKFATPDDLAAIRQAVAGASGVAPVPPPAPSASTKKVAAKKSTKRAGAQRSSARRRPAARSRNRVFVVHGRDEPLRRAMFDFLRALGLQPIEWQKALAETKTASPLIPNALDRAFENATAVVVLLSPDDEARLRPDLLKKNDPPYERNLTGQARPNVLFEAGMAFGHKPDATVLVQVGETRPFSDVAGRHVNFLDNSPESRIELANKLETAGCDVDRGGTDWLKSGDFEPDL